jgi:hypothetical protein
VRYDIYIHIYIYTYIYIYVIRRQRVKWRCIFAHSVIFTHNKQRLLAFVLNSINWFVFAVDKQRVTCEVNF